MKIIAGKTLKPLTDFRWATVRAYVQSDKGKQREAGVSAVFAFAALALSESIAEEVIYHNDFDALHMKALEMGSMLTNDEAQSISDYINDTLGLTEAAHVDTPEGKP